MKYQLKIRLTHSPKECKEFSSIVKKYGLEYTQIFSDVATDLIVTGTNSDSRRELFDCIEVTDFIFADDTKAVPI